MSSAIDILRRACRARASLSIALGTSLLVPCAVAAQSFKAQDLAPGKPDSSLEGRTQALDEIFRDYWQEKLKHSPEFASAIGDTRYDDQLSDNSPSAYNDALARSEQFIDRLGAIDTAGMSDLEKSRKDMLVRHLIDQQESSACKPWQTPVTESYGIQVQLPLLAETLRFTSAEDYDRYVARLNRIPAAFLQIATDLSLGQQAGHSEPQATMQKVLSQVNEIVRAQPEDTSFARPLSHFPDGLSPQQQTDIRNQVLTVIRKQVQPAYARFSKYLSTQYIPQANSQPASTGDMSQIACSVATNAQDFDAGRSKILELRAEAEKSLGNNFNLNAFRDQVRASDSMPPDLFEKHIQQWIAQQGK